MKISYITDYDAQDVKSWSGTPYYMSQSLGQIASQLEYIGPLQTSRRSKLSFRSRQIWHKLLEGKRYIRDADLQILKQFGRQTRLRLNQSDSDLIFSPTTYTLAYLECKQPMVFWADATFIGLIDYYPFYSNLCQQSIRNGIAMEQSVLDRCRLAIFSSDWAAKDAITKYQVDPAKVKVVPYGANLVSQRTLEDVKTIVKSRPSDRCKLLFLGVHWQRKGGETVLAVAKALNQAGLKTELTLVGCQPPPDTEIPAYVNCLGFISKSTAAGQQQIDRLLAESHFLIVPSQAENYGIVFCEANSFGTPCLATKTGGIPTIIQEGLNGKLFDLNNSISEYCDYVVNLFANYSSYQQLALSAFAEYESRLNWQVASERVRQLLTEAT
jgi:glycosyltransferase involved in cell wall biosynthesis